MTDWKFHLPFPGPHLVVTVTPGSLAFGVALPVALLLIVALRGLVAAVKFAAGVGVACLVAAAALGRPGGFYGGGITLAVAAAGWVLLRRDR
jgi:uncharacterized protein (TIGR03382 family)